jgi:hypothetical protein
MTNVNSQIEEFCDALDETEYWHISPELLKAYSGIFNDFNFEYLSWALGYYMPMEVKSENEAFTPAFEFGNKSFPPKLNSLSEEVISVWNSSLVLLDHSLVAKSRLSDLLWNFKYGTNPKVFAEKAIISYVAIAEELNWKNIYKSVILSRAFRLSLEIQNELLNLKVRNCMVGLIDESLALDSSEPGVVLPLVEVLIENPQRDSDSHIIRILDKSEEKYAGNPFVLDQVNVIRASNIRSQESLKSLAKKRITTWELAAKEEGGLIAILHLEKAIAIANDAKLLDESERLHSSLEKLVRENPPKLDPLTVKVDLDVNAFQNFLDTFTSDAVMELNIRRLASEVPLELHPNLDDEYLQKLMAEHPLGFLFTKVILNSEGLPMKSLQTPKEIAFHDQLDEDTRRILFWGECLIQIIDLLTKNEEDFLQAVYLHLKSSDLLSKNDVHVFMSSFRNFVLGHMSESIYPLLPRLEGVLRNLVEELGMPIFTVKNKDKSTSYILLGQILSKLTPFGDPRMWAYAKSLLNCRYQLNLRNEYLHGLIERPSKLHAVLLLHLVLQVSMLRIG